MTVEYRKALSSDLQRCTYIRGATRDNAFSEAELKAIGVTNEAWQPKIDSGVFIGFVCGEAE